MQGASSSAIIAALALFMSLVAGRSCHVETLVGHIIIDKSRFISRPCPDIILSYYVENATFWIDGEVKWNATDTGRDAYKPLGTGSGYDVDAGAVSFHIDPIGVPEKDLGPDCKIHFKDAVNVGIGNASVFGPFYDDVTETNFNCYHDWGC